MARPAAGLVYIGIKGRVLALDRRTGDLMWGTHLKGSGFVCVQRDGDLILAATAGEIFAISPKTGDLQWHNPLKGYGVGFASVVGQAAVDSAMIASAAAIRAQAEAAAGAG
jgi:outer membrane protein assembly factor BamB